MPARTNQKKDVSIEYAHIYTNNKIGDEEKLSLEILGNLQKELDSKNLSATLLILIDDYSFPDPTFDYGALIAWWTGKGFKPDLVLRESQLIPLCDEVISKLRDNKIKEQLVDYIKSKKYPCSLFIAAWYLLRLGHLKHDSFSEDLYAKRLINILPESFKPFEDKALEIMAASEFSGAEKLVEYSFIHGRLVA